MRALFAIVVLLLYAAPSLAQTGAPASWTLRIYQAGSTVALSTLTIPASQVTCNQTATEAAVSTNPNKWRWDDVANAGKVFVYDDTMRLAALPDGSYEGTAVATNASGSSAETAHVPFTRLRPNPPAVPTGLSFTP